VAKEKSDNLLNGASDQQQIVSGEHFVHGSLFGAIFCHWRKSK